MAGMSAATSSPPVLVHRDLGTCDYRDSFAAMRAFTHARDDATADELWTLEHPPVYTRGQRDHGTWPGTQSIDVVDSDRGGLITYHGPGQLVIYTLIDLRRAGLGIRSLVCQLEQLVIDLCYESGIVAGRRQAAPGVYVDGHKLASLGLRVRNARSYHGVAINVDMDMTPFTYIEPCGLEGIEMTQLRDLGCTLGVNELATRAVSQLATALGARAIDRKTTLPGMEDVDLDGSDSELP